MKNKHFKRLISLILVVVMLASMLPAIPITVNAADGTTEASLSFADKAQRTSYSTSIQVWEQNGITVTNNKSSSTTNVADYAKPARFYASSNLVVEAPGNITKIVFDANSAAYATALNNSIGTVSGATVSVSSDKVTVTFSTAVESFTIAKLTAQVRMDSLTVTYQVAASCKHSNTMDVILNAASCTEAGSKNIVCADCPDTIEENVTIEALGHDDSDGDGYCNREGCGLPVCNGNHTWGDWIVSKEATCTESEEQTRKCVCGETETKTTSEPLGHNIEIRLEQPATCTQTGLTQGEYCTRCDYEIKQTETSIIDHTYVDGKCSVCGASKTNYPVSPAEIKSNDRIVIVIKSGSTYYALSSSNGASKAPDAVKITISDETITSDVNGSLIWNIAYENNGNMTIYPKGTTAKWLYCTNSNDGVRVGTNDNKVFTIDSSSGYLKNTATSRYVGVYTTNPDWRCYTNTTGNIANQTIYFYKLECVEHNLETVPASEKTCTTDGHSEYQKCTICESEFNKTVIPASHTEVEIPGKEATCQETGLTDGIGCSQCDVIIKAQESIDMIPCSDGNDDDDNCDSCGNPMCEHEWKNVGDSTATCESDGKQAQICSKCEREQEITVEKLGHDIISVAETPATCDTPGTTAGTKCQRDGCDYFTGMEKIPATGHNYVNGACSNCGRAKPFIDQYALVTDTNSLEVGDKIVIVAKDYNYALSTEQKNNNRGQIEITKDGTSLSINDSVQIITLGEGTVDGTFAFYTGSGYLYAASSSSNHLKTQDKNNANGSWKIEISENGVATIKAQGEYTRNLLKYNDSSALFSCYGSGQQDIVIYKLVEAPKLSGYIVTLNKGVTVNLTYNVPAEWLAANEGAYVTFNGDKTELTAGANNFTVTLTPKKVNDDLFLTLYTADGTVVTKHNVGVATYKSTIESLTAAQLGISDAKYAALTTLLNKVVVYGNASTNTLEQDLDVETFEGVDDWSGADDTYDVFKDISAELSEQADMYITINKENVDLDYTITITRGTTTLASGSINTFITKDGYIVIAGLFPADFNKEITITVSDGSDVIAEASFTFNEYLKALYTSISDTYFKNMIAATYQYGSAVDAFVKAE